MHVKLDSFGLSADVSFATSYSSFYRPPKWPPPKDWACVEDADGKVVSRWGDASWDLSPFVGRPFWFHFGDGSKSTSKRFEIDSVNADILRLLITVKIWGPHAPRSISGIYHNYFGPFRKIVLFCSRNNIPAYDLSKYPQLVDEVARIIPTSKYDQIIGEFARLLDLEYMLGFKLLNKSDIQRLKQLQRERITEQTEYIPPRIWAYQVSRYRECLDGYLSIQRQIEECFDFCLEAYRTNYGGSRAGPQQGNPFSLTTKGYGPNSGCTYYGAFIQTAERFGIKDEIERWGLGHVLKSKGVSAFSAYLTLVTVAALAYIANFTLMRREEVGSLRSNCLEWHEDPVFGRIPLIRGETTKTDPDKNALWITTPSTEVAVNALYSIASLRRKALPEDLSQHSTYLYGWASEPWACGHKGAIEKSRKKFRPLVTSLSECMKRFPALLNSEQLRITEEDLKIARAISPTLNKDAFQVGKVWPLTWHQFRRTGAVNMFASGAISNSSIQLQMKHLSSMMPMYYGNGSNNLRFNEELRTILINAQYEVMGQEFVAVSSDRFVSPHGPKHKELLLHPNKDRQSVRLISQSDALHYEAAARKGQINFRRTVVGGCMRNGLCTSDGITSISDCTGNREKSPCAYTLFDREKAAVNLKRLEGVKQELAGKQPGTAQYLTLEQEKQGLENYFAYIA